MAKGAALVRGQHLHALWSKYGPRRALGYDGFPGVKAGKEKPWALSEILLFICNGGELLLALSASLGAAGLQNDARSKPRGLCCCLGKLSSCCLRICLFSFFPSFNCFVFTLFQTAGSVSFIRLIDDGQCGYMENRTCLNS